MWKMTNGLGKEVTWYSKEEMEEYALQILRIHLKFLKQNGKLNRHDVYNKALSQIINFFEEDKKFARYDGSPVIFTSLALDKIKEIIKENNIIIGEVRNENE